MFAVSSTRAAASASSAARVGDRVHQDIFFRLVPLLRDLVYCGGREGHERHGRRLDLVGLRVPFRGDGEREALRREAQGPAGRRWERPRVEGHAPGVSISVYTRMLVEARARGGAAALACGRPAAERQAAALHPTCWALYPGRRLPLLCVASFL